MLLAHYETFTTNAPASTTSTPASASRGLRNATHHATPLFTGKKRSFLDHFCPQTGGTHFARRYLPVTAGRSANLNTYRMPRENRGESFRLRTICNCLPWALCLGCSSFEKCLTLLRFSIIHLDVASRISNSHDVRRRLRSNLCDLRAGLSQRNSIHIR